VSPRALGVPVKNALSAESAAEIGHVSVAGGADDSRSFLRKRFSYAPSALNALFYDLPRAPKLALGYNYFTATRLY
jgi:hypothetical protein